MDRGGGQVVSVLAFNSNNPSLNPNEVYNFLLFKKQKIGKLKSPWLAHPKKEPSSRLILLIVQNLFYYIFKPR